MSGLKIRPEIYTQQLGAYTREISIRPAPSFCRHFTTVLGSKDTALTQLKAVVQLQPEDKLSAAPVKALTTGADAGGEQPRTGPGG